MSYIIPTEDNQEPIYLFDDFKLWIRSIKKKPYRKIGFTNNILFCGSVCYGNPTQPYIDTKTKRLIKPKKINLHQFYLGYVKPAKDVTNPLDFYLFHEGKVIELPKDFLLDPEFLPEVKTENIRDPHLGYKNGSPGLLVNKKFACYYIYLDKLGNTVKYSDYIICHVWEKKKDWTFKETIVSSNT